MKVELTESEVTTPFQCRKFEKKSLDFHAKMAVLMLMTETTNNRHVGFEGAAIS